MQSKVHAIWFAALTAVATQVQADDRGRWLCSDCEISGSTGVAVGAASDIVMFITGVVNVQAFKQIPGVTAPTSGWKPYDLVTVCNGSTCMTLVYYPAGVFVPSLAPFRDSGKGYKNAALQQRSGSTGELNASYLLNYVWNDWTASVQPYSRVYTITAGPLVPAQSLPDNRIVAGNSSFTTGFSWGGYLDSNTAGGNDYYGIAGIWSTGYQFCPAGRTCQLPQ